MSGHGASDLISNRLSNISNRFSCRAARTILFLALVASSQACGENRTPDAVAHVDAWIFTEGQLADLLVLAQPFSLDSASVADLAWHWIAAAALAQRAATGDSLTGADAIGVSTWMEVREALLEADRADRLEGVEVDEPHRAFEEGEYRLVAHVLRRVGAETSAAERALQHGVAERLLADLIQGGSWDDAVVESEDLQTRATAGLLGLFAAGELPPELDRVVFGMEPGQVSSITESRSGYHILYRPRFGDVADLFAHRLRERRLIEADASSSPSLMAERGLVISSQAVQSFRRLLGDPLHWWKSTTELLAWDSGALSEGTAARYLLALPAAARIEMGVANEATLGSLLEELALREMRLFESQERNLVPDVALVAALEQQHRDEVHQWMEALEVEVGGTADQAALGRYMEDLVARQRTAPTPAPLFEAWLLDHVEWSLSAPGLARATAAARAMLETAARQ